MIEDFPVHLQNQAIVILRERYAQAGQSAQFEALHPLVLGLPTALGRTFAEVAEELQAPEKVVRFRACRLRKAFRATLRELGEIETRAAEATPAASGDAPDDDDDDEGCGVPAALDPRPTLTGGAAKKVPELDPDEREDA